jgi:hypothetical protein
MIDHSLISHLNVTNCSFLLTNLKKQAIILRCVCVFTVYNIRFMSIIIAANITHLFEKKEGETLLLVKKYLHLL